MQEKALWAGGRMSGALDQTMAELNRSLSVDKRMAEQDIRGSIAWAGATAKVGILSDEEHALIVSGLEQALEEIRTDTFVFMESDEDIHTAVERRLTEIIGPTGGKLHTGRSRNDQVVTDFRLWMKDELPVLKEKLLSLMDILVKRTETDMDVMFNGYTHFRQAQPILLSHWWMSHFWALSRDLSRLEETIARADSMPLGCGALAGTAYPVDRPALAEALGFDHAAENSLDAVSDRDFVCDFLYWASMLGIHLSRCAEAMILYSTTEFGYITLSDAFSTGSSLMPQKKNPDSLELIRGKCGVQTGRLMSILELLKGLPSAYDKDLQEDKALVFAAYDTAALVMDVMGGVISTLRVNKERCASAINTQALATDLADYLVKKGMPFREAHHAVGKSVRIAEESGCALSDLPLETWQQITPLFGEDVYSVFDPAAAVANRCAMGGTSGEMVRKQIDSAKSLLNRYSVLK